VFAHGFSATPESYAGLLAHWASAGYVVAAPTFPLSSGTSPCGAVAGDVVNQPQDMSYVITSVLRAAKGADGPLAGLVDADHIGAAGHSNGGITTYGLVGNTKLRDDRITAAAILAGTAQKYPKGKYDLAHLPPVLFAHGTDDDLVPYSAAINGFNAARGPKGLLSITGGDHGSSASPSVYDATTDFFDAYLRDDAAARERLPDDQVEGTSTMKFVTEKGAQVTVPTVTTPKLNLKASVSPRKNLQGGQMVTVSWSGYTPGKVVNILQCNGLNRDQSKSNECDYSKAKLLQPDPTGNGSLQLEIIEGPIGTGVCDADHPGCFIIVNNASSTDPKDSVQVDISFAKAK
jgi:dienelactone hydrolase